MSNRFRVRRWALIGASVAVVAAGGAGIAMASTTSGHHGQNEYGMTHAFYNGKSADFTYTHGYYCDTTVASKADTKCEVGANFKVAPAKSYDPLYITVPLGFSVPMSMIDCPANLKCVDHPAHIDLSRLEPALKPLYPKLTKAQLTKALGDFVVPEHDHFVTDTNKGKPEWWDVKVIGVTSKTVFEQIHAHKSYRYIQSLLHAKNKNVLGPIDTNLFLYFSVQ